MAFGLSAGAAGLMGAVAGPLIGGLMGGAGSSSGGQQTQAVSKDPWSVAAPWLKNNVQTGQNLQNFYQQNPFNRQQQNAYGNLSAGTNYANQVTPGLLQQMSQPQGFDRNNPRARPQPFNFAAPSGPSSAQNLGYGGAMTQSAPMGNMNQSANPFGNGGIPTTAAPQLTTEDIMKLIASNQPAAQAPAQDQWTSADRN